MHKINDISYEEIFDYIDEFNDKENEKMRKFRQDCQRDNIPIIKKDVEDFLRFYLNIIKPEKILEIDTIERVRVSSVYPDTITDKFLCMLKNNPKLMPHLHVSIQTMDDKILHLMRRKYEADFVVKVLQKVQKEVPQVSLTADVIVGFPQEGEGNFSNTLKNLELIGFSDLHVFPYSDREKTTAAMLDGKIDPQIKKHTRCPQVGDILIHMSLINGFCLV